MDTGNLHLLSTYLKKWSYQDNRISVSYSYFTEMGYGRQAIDMRINSPQNMVNEFLNRSIYKVKEYYQNSGKVNGDFTVKLVNETEAQRKLNLFLTKILKEFTIIVTLASSDMSGALSRKKGSSISLVPRFLATSMASATRATPIGLFLNGLPGPRFPIAREHICTP